MRTTFGFITAVLFMAGCSQSSQPSAVQTEQEGESGVEAVHSEATPDLPVTVATEAHAHTDLTSTTDDSPENTVEPVRLQVYEAWEDRDIILSTPEETAQLKASGRLSEDALFMHRLAAPDYDAAMRQHRMLIGSGEYGPDSGSFDFVRNRNESPFRFVGEIHGWGYSEGAVHVILMFFDPEESIAPFLFDWT